jgi:outer membrane immunogenic protein
MNKKLLFVTASLAAISVAAPAMAADLAARPYTKAPPMVAPIYDWSGFYIGINGGGGSDHNCWSEDVTANALIGVPGDNGCHNATGGTVGGQIGYRWQAATWVFGLEAQGNWADFTGSHDPLADTIFAGALSARSKTDAFGLFTGQVGYAWNNVLLYVKGGAAVVSTKHELFDNTVLATFGTASDTRWGGTVGAGLEFGFSPNWSLGFEYNHIFISGRDVDFSAPGGGFVGTEHIKQDIDMGLVRLNYKFGGPIIAKY